MKVIVRNSATQAEVSRFKNAKKIIDEDILSFTVIDDSNGRYWYNKTVYEYEVINDN